MGGWVSVAADVLDCNNVLDEFKLQLPYNVHFLSNTFGKGVKPFISFNYGLNSTTTVLLKDGFDLQ